MKTSYLINGAVTAIALSMAAYHLYVVFFGVPSVFFFRGTHLLFSLILIFLIHPFRKSQFNTLSGRALDAIFVLCSITCIAHIFINHDYILNRFAYVDDLSALDLTLGTGLILLTLEATRRVIGLALSLIHI